jgi:WD40 repeat protein
MIRVLRSVLVMLLSLLPAGLAPAADRPSTTPLLKLDTGMHTLPIRTAAVDGEGRFLVTASLDKTARLWSLATGELIRVLRPAIGDGAEGKIYAVAMSPDGQFVVAGGFTGYAWEKANSLYVFEAGTGRLVHRVGGLPEIVNRLGWSPDGRLLAAALGGANGIRVFQTGDWHEVGRDPDYADAAYGLAFDRSGRLAASGLDGYIRLYDRDLKRIAKVKAAGGAQPSTLAFSPDGAALAVAYFGAGKVEIMSVPELRSLAAPNVAGLTGGSLSQVAWTADSALIAGGQYFAPGTGSPIVRWADHGRGRRTVLAAADGSVAGIVPLADGGFVYATADPAFGRYDARGDRVLDYRPNIADFRNQTDKLRVAPDGTKVAFGLNKGGTPPAWFDAATRRLIVGNPPAPWRTADTASLPIRDWQENAAPTLAGRPLKLEKNEISHGIAIAPDRNSFLLGTNLYLYRFGSGGEEIWSVPVQGEAWAVNVSADGRLAIAALADGTIRWYRYEDGQPLLALFPHRDGRRWVLWTPEGYYDASPGGEDLIGWHVNRALDQEADFFPASRFRDRFYKPAAVAAVLRTLDTAQALAQTGPPPPPALPLQQILPPVVRILSPGEGQAVTASPVEIRYSVRSPSGERVTSVEARIDDRPLSGERGLKRIDDAGSVPPAPDAELKGSLSIPLAQDATISVIARAGERASEAASVHVVWKGTVATGIPKPKLYVLAIGVSKYQDKDLILPLASKDTDDVATVLATQKDVFYSDVIETKLLDAGATKTDIIDGLAWLKQKATERDVAVVYLAGHGDNEANGDYYFLPVEVNQEQIEDTGVPKEEFLRTVAHVSGKVLVFLDTCHSGALMSAGRNPDINGLMNELADQANGLVVFSASTGRESALESKEWNNGAFTKALVEAFSGGAGEQFRGGTITVLRLGDWLTTRVAELTKDQQHPTFAAPTGIRNFTVATVSKADTPH